MNKNVSTLENVIQRRRKMHCPDCGKPMVETQNETIDRGTFTEMAKNFKCNGWESGWEFNYDTMNQERVLRAMD